MLRAWILTPDPATVHVLNTLADIHLMIVRVCRQSLNDFSNVEARV